jgi:hypothetical protein
LNQSLTVATVDRAAQIKAEFTDLIRAGGEGRLAGGEWDGGDGTLAKVGGPPAAGGVPATWSNTGQILVKYWAARRGCAAVTSRSNAGQTRAVNLSAIPGRKRPATGHGGG